MYGDKLSWRFVVLFCMSALTLTGCGGVKVGCLVLGGGHSAELQADTSSFKTLGEQVWQLLRDSAAKSEKNAEEKVAIWDKNKEKFVTAFDTFVPYDQAVLLAKTAGDVYTFVDDGTIPKMTDAIASIIEAIYTNPEDPDKRALKGLHELLKPQTATLDPDVFTEILGRILAHEEIQDFIAAIGHVIRSNDGVDENGQPNGEQDLLTDLFKALSDRISEANTQSSNSNSFNGVIEHLLQTRDLPSTLDLGEPAWVAELDENNNPIVAINPNTGHLYEPFVDVNMDGKADTNVEGLYTDANGDIVDIPAFGPDGYRDADKRALHQEGGDPIYVYFDAKRTALSGLLMFVGDLFEEDLPREIRPVVEAILGQQVLNDNETPGDLTDDYYHYPEQDHPLLDLMWSALELTRSSEFSDLTSNLGGVNLEERNIAERLVLYSGKILKAFQEEDFLKEYDTLIKLLDMVDNLLPIVDEIFEKSNATSQSTGEILMEVMQDLADDESEEEVDNQFGLMIQYRNLVYDDTPSGKVLNTTESIPVDYTQPMYFGSEDNRSIVEKTVALIILLDGPTLPLSSNNLADIALNSIADGTSNGGLMNFILGNADVPVMEALAVPLLNLFGYPGQEVWNALEVYDSLTATGSTEGFSTILKVFKDQDQMGLVKEIFHVLHSDLQRDLDNDPNTFSVIRKSEEPLSTIFQSTIMEDLTTLLNTMEEANQISNNSGATNNFGEIADAVAFLIDDDDLSLTHRDGTPAKSRVHWLTRPLRTMLLRIEEGGQFDNLTESIKSTLNIITESIWNDNGTPGDSTDDFEELARPALASVLKALNTYSGQGDTQTQQDVNDFVDEQQMNLVNDLAGKALPSGITLWKSIDESEQSDGFYQAIRNILKPQPNEIYKDVFASLMTILGQMLENGVENEYEADLNAYLAYVLDDHNGYIVDVILGLESIATAGVELSVLDLLKNLLWKGEDGMLKSPADSILEIIRELQDLEDEEGADDTYTAEDLEETLKNLVNFARDDVDAGLPAFYDIIKKRD